MNNSDREHTITLSILEAIDERSDLTQRGLAQRTGVALGLANSYLKRCARKGFVKVQQAPANRYLYYLTPRGFAEKSRLTAEYLRYSLRFYSKACDSCDEVMEQLVAANVEVIGSRGASELGEIAMLRARACGLEVGAVVDSACAGSSLGGHTVVAEIPKASSIEAWLVTDLRSPQSAYDELCDGFGPERVFAPAILGLRLRT
jgi:DNA-binding MarR family transcriptional regulator